MSSVNKATVLGRVGKDPECRTLDNGKVVASFSLATSESYKDKTGEKKEITDWHNITAFGYIADIIQKYIKKGSLIYVEGKLRTRSWEKDGVTRYTTEILADSVKMLGGGNSGGGGSSNSTNSSNSSDDNSDDLPF